MKLASSDGDREIHPSLTKLQKRLPKSIPRFNVPLGALHVLKRSADVTTIHTERLPPHLALQMVLRYTFMARYGETKLGRDHLAGHMRRCSAAVAQIRVYDLFIPDDLGALDTLAEAIASKFSNDVAA